MELIDALRREWRPNPWLTLSLSLTASLSTLLIVASVGAAAESAAQGQVSFKAAMLFLVALATGAMAQRKLMGALAEEAEFMVHRMRTRLFSIMSRTDPTLISSSARGQLFIAITQQTQVLSRHLSTMIVGAQQGVLVILISLYMAFLSLAAFALIAFISALIVFIHVVRMRQIGSGDTAAESEEAELYGLLEEVLLSQRELRLSQAHSDQLRESLAQASARTQATKVKNKAAWAREAALLQAAFYLLVGVVIFAVPLFSQQFHSVAFPGTMAALFMIGPVGSMASALAVAGDAQRVLRLLKELEFQLSAGAAPTDEPTLPEEVRRFPDGIHSLELCDLAYTYPSTLGEPGFRVGPLSASFRAGEVNFITGGNGSGKTTMVQLLTGLLIPTAGLIRVNGQSLDSSSMQAWRDCISAVFSDGHLFSRLYGVSDQALAQAPAWLERLGLSSVVRIENGAFSTVSLSSGQRKRLALLASLLEDKPVLVLDEWAADQDPHWRRVFYEELLPELRAQDRLVICITHDESWFGVADQRLHMSEGRFRK
jgi:putative ATP-binding cassette transporter